MESSCAVCAGKDQVNKAIKGEKASGLYFPIAAVQVCGSNESATGLLSSVPQCWAFPADMQWS